MKVLVDGTDEYVTAHIIYALEKRGHDVVVLINYETDFASELCRSCDCIVEVMAPLLWSSPTHSCNKLQHLAEKYDLHYVVTNGLDTVTRTAQNSRIYTETDWHDKNNPLSQTVESVCIISTGLIVGRTLTGDVPKSCLPLVHVWTNRIGAPDMRIPVVDVLDVADLHVMAVEKSLRGRFLCVGDHLSLRDVKNYARQKYPTMRLAQIPRLPRFLANMTSRTWTSSWTSTDSSQWKQDAVNAVVGRKMFLFSNLAARRAGFNFRSRSETLDGLLSGTHLPP